MFPTTPFISEKNGKNVSTGKGRGFFIKGKCMLINKETITLINNILFVSYTTLEKHVNLQRAAICFEKKRHQ